VSDDLDAAGQDAFDVIVVGSGAGGLSAAVTAAHFGLRVLVTEKTPFYGGSTAVSGGAVWIPDNPLMRAAGHADSRECVMTYLRAAVEPFPRAELMDAYLDQGPRMVEFMGAHTAVKFAARAHSPDYLSSYPGASMGGRTLDPLEFDASELGDHFAQLRRPYPQFMALGGMMVNRKDVEHLTRALCDRSSLAYSLRLIARHARSRLRFSRGTRLLLGNALAARLLKSALDLGVTLQSRTGARRIVRGGGRVSGLVLSRDGREEVVVATRGIVLSSGGFAADPAWRDRLVPRADVHVSLAPEGNTGDGLAMAQAVGGVVEPVARSATFGTPVSMMAGDGGAVRAFPHLVTDRQKPGVIAVSARGQRFTDESASYHAFTQAMHRAAAIPAFLICDRTAMRRYGIGMVRPSVRGLGALSEAGRYVRAGYLYEGSSLRELARRAGIEADNLVGTVERHNRHALAGEDPDFGRGSEAYSRYLGDAEHRPNPCLAPIEAPPFYAVRLVPGDIGSAVGLRTNAHAQVLDRDDSPIAGLYACGNDMNSVMMGNYPAAGITLGPALTFGYIAGRHLAGVAG